MVGKESIEQHINIEDVSADLNDLERYVEDLTSFIPLPLVTLNPALKIIDINNSFLFTTGYAQHEILSATIDIFFKNQQVVHEIINKTHDAGATKNYETIILTKEKKEIPVSVTSVIRTDENGSIIGYFIAFIDISDLKQIEQSLHEKIDKLQKSELATLNIMEDLQNTISALTLAESQIRDKNNELQMINTELTSAREALTILNRDLEKKVKERTADVEKLLKQKDEFISQLGHDLKTPLTPLNILIPIVKEREQDPKLKELLEVISNNLQYMKNLVIKTLELAQLNSDNFKFGFEDINLSQKVRSILEMESTFFEGKNVNIQNNIPQDITVQVDVLQIKELFDNLVSNAIKYSQPEGVQITLDAKKKDDLIIVSIKDTGFGIESHEIEHVFDEFYKVDYSRHDIQSTGLGLSICKRIIEKHGGRIWVESQGKGKGSTFFFTLKIPIK
ncbi:MAG: PAS domain-containing sensor histidine kinase [Euryarchaeota archaeon]|jgi:PAS domain S-box-containing protein|nr:PAS domain-containing sensor histidine kinase [Euryarchaeota archaeon]